MSGCYSCQSPCHEALTAPLPMTHNPYPCSEITTKTPIKPTIKTTPERECLLNLPLNPMTKICQEPRPAGQLPNNPIIAEFESVPTDITANNDGTVCYLPQPGDELPAKTIAEPMGPIGPWATGRVDWSPLAGLTGTRPVVDRYSITRYSTNEWRKRNMELINRSFNSFERGLKTENDSKNTMTRTFALCDQAQADSTKRLKIRSQDLNKWKDTLERAIKAMADELSTLEEQRVRLKQSLFVLRTPEAIASECLDRRCSRPDTELVRDNPEEELIKELALIAEIQDLFNRTLKDIDSQQIENRTARERLEYDWSDKKDACEIDAINCSLNNNSTTVHFKPGATRYMNEQSSEEYWEHFTKETLEECEKTRQKSVTLRGTLDAILLNAARDLRNQADAVERALSARVSCMDEIRVKLENDLFECLRRLAETEKQIDRLTLGMQNLDNSMKVAQTRLDNRNQRAHVENCRDRTHYGLFDEVKIVQNGVSAMLAAIKDAEDTKITLMNNRGELEREIMLKRKSIMLDRDRCLLIRSHFPSASALSGYS